MNLLDAFLRRLNSDLQLKQHLITESGHRLYLLNDALKRFTGTNFFHAGTYLGKLQGRIFSPSISLLRLIAQTRANRTVVTEKTAWLFICGRDIFEEGIITVEGAKEKGDLTLILNQHGECLGLGRFTHDITGKRRQRVAIRRVLDIGDFLRRERQ